MPNQTRKLFASFLIALGVVLLVTTYFGTGAGAVFWPMVLIFAGLWFILRPGLSTGEYYKLGFVTDIYKHSDWQVGSEGMLAFVHEIDYDFTTANVPSGETNITLTAFVTDLELRVPADVGLSVNTSAIVSESRINGNKQEYILRSMKYSSPNYTESERKIRFDINSIVVELKVTS